MAIVFTNIISVTYGIFTLHIILSFCLCKPTENNDDNNRTNSGSNEKKIAHIRSNAIRCGTFGGTARTIHDYALLLSCWSVVARTTFPTGIEYHHIIYIETK